MCCLTALRTLPLAACVMIMTLCAATSAGYELHPMGPLPELSADWEISVDDQQGATAARSPFQWIVFRNKKSGDRLSFAARPPETGESRGLEYWSDTALEIFPDGRPVWTQSESGAATTVLSIGVAKRKQILAYCFVSESPKRENLMAHGRAWVSKNGVMFVQHTSANPITAAFLEDTVAKAIRMQRSVD